MSWMSGSCLVVVWMCPHTLTSTTRSPDVIHVICVLAQCVILNTNWRTKNMGQGFFREEGGIGRGAFAPSSPPPPWICWESYFTYKSIQLYCHNKWLIMFVRKQSQIASNKKSKIKISWSSTPPDPPSLPHALRTDMYLPPPIIYTISFWPPLPPPPWAKSWKKPWGRLGNESTNLLDINHNLLS